jgi:hypothetical protein
MERTVKCYGRRAEVAEVLFICSTDTSPATLRPAAAHSITAELAGDLTARGYNGPVISPASFSNSQDSERQTLDLQ